MAGKRRIWWSIPIIAASCLFLTGCNIFFRDEVRSDSNETIPPTETETEAVTEAETETETKPVRRKYPLQEHTVDGVSIAVNGSWVFLPDQGENGIFCDTERGEYYQIQMVCPIGSLTPDEFYFRLVEGWDAVYTVTETDFMMEEIKTVDGQVGYLGKAEMLSEDTFFSAAVLAVPNKNQAVILTGQCELGKELSTDLREIVETAIFSLGNRNMAEGSVLEDTEGGTLKLKADGLYEQITPEGEEKGTYLIYRGEEAVSEVSELKQYGMGYAELQDILKSHRDGYTMQGMDADPVHVCLDNFYAILLQGKNTTGITLYIGYYIPEYDGFDLTNCNTSTPTLYLRRRTAAGELMLPR